MQEQESRRAGGFSSFYYSEGGSNNNTNSNHQENGGTSQLSGSYHGRGLRISGISYFTPVSAATSQTPMTCSSEPYSYTYDPVRGGFLSTNEARDGCGLGSGAYTAAMNRLGEQTQWKRQTESEANCCSRCSACSSSKDTPKWQLSREEIELKNNAVQGRDLLERYKIQDEKQFRPYSPDTKSLLSGLVGYKGESIDTSRPSYKSYRSSEFTKIDTAPYEKQFDTDKENNQGSYFHQHNTYPKSKKPYETHTIYMNTNPISIKSVTLNSKYDPAARYERNPDEPNNFFKRVRMGRLYADKTPWEYYLHYDENDHARDSYQTLKTRMDEYNSKIQSKENRKNQIVMDTDEFRKMVDNLTKKNVSSQETQTSEDLGENNMDVPTKSSLPSPVVIPSAMNAQTMVMEEELTSSTAGSFSKGSLPKQKNKKKKESKKNNYSSTTTRSDLVSSPGCSITTATNRRKSPSTAPPTSTPTSRLNQLSDAEIPKSKHPRVITAKSSHSKKSKQDLTKKSDGKTKTLTKPERINTTSSYYSNCSSSSSINSKSTRSSLITEVPPTKNHGRKNPVSSSSDNRFMKSMKRIQSAKKKAETVDKYIHLLASPEKQLVRQRMDSSSRHSSPSSKSTKSVCSSSMTTTSARLNDDLNSSQFSKEYDEICSVLPSTVSTAVATSKTVQKCFDDVLKYFEKHKFDSALKENASDLEDVTLSEFSEDTDILAKYHSSDYEDQEEGEALEDISEISEDDSYDEFTQDTENLMLNASSLSISSNCSIDTISMSSSRDDLSLVISRNL
ncbi:hypothetical protein FDP41_008110 [Naegleria fowleri]|uniref:Uncharacterized protein n=1 Tax=Naegleria fowleri TaxID=5763 RepID=A0A6A5BFJ6_NAEFO|nr:uncharacterized protein FDP41_008110 [Naegleria fowleri]KAF0973406.1 hypothetical protein FDP41_008110 [Naegleria fowleri]